MEGRRGGRRQVIMTGEDSEAVAREEDKER
jgi:hypothetical protein